MNRQFPARDGDERTLLTGWMDWHRATVRYKCEGVSEADAHRAPLPSSPLMTMAGLVSHLRLNEEWWFETHLLGTPDQSPDDPDDPDAEMRVDGIPLADLLDEYEAQCARSRRAVADLDLDAPAKGTPTGGAPITVRWALLHMIEETARHNGHLDAIRELVDGVTGD